jgi:predicted PurR-regulated permease PerM
VPESQFNPPEESRLISPSQPDPELDRRLASRLLEVLVRAGLLLALVLLCYAAIAPFLTLLIWSVILAVTLYPVHQLLAGKLGGRQGLAATLLVVLGVVLIVVPSSVLLTSLADSLHRLIRDVQTNSLAIRAPSDAVATWPIVGPKLHALWSQAHADLPALIRRMQPQIGDLTKSIVGFVAGIGGSLLMFLAAFVIAGIVMAFGKAGDRASRAIFARILGTVRGAQLAHLSTSTIRAVALGVIGVAFVQAIIVGVCLLVAGIPWAGVLAFIVLVLAIAQVPTLIVTLPAIGYIWWSGDYGNATAIVYTVLLVIAGMADNVLKPLMLGRGVEAPMPVILLGALGGMATSGILGLFVGATILALGYRLFMSWVATSSGAEAVTQDSEISSTSSPDEAALN